MATCIVGGKEATLSANLLQGVQISLNLSNLQHQHWLRQYLGDETLGQVHQRPKKIR